ncbi:MAG: glutamate--tRNA ligase [Candidatus Aenigmatarchaeota archaeon]
MKDLFLKYALLNAVEHGGKANLQAVIGKVIAENPNLKERVKEVIPEIKKIIEEVNALSLEEQKNRLKELKIEIKKEKIEEKLELPELINAKEGKVVLRLAPFPDAPLHIGQARMVILNDYYAKKYKGKLYLVMDDTIGSEEKSVDPKAYKWILEDLKWLGIKPDKIFYKSDRLKKYYEVSELLIKKGYAYVCFCDTETLRKNRREGIACEHRNHSIEENLRFWKEMLKGKYKEGEAVLRLKTDMRHPNPAFRDRVLFRIVERKHPRVGLKYKVWPLLEFSWAVDDYYLGITHIIRGKDLIMEDLMEDFIWQALGWKKSYFIHYGLFTIKEVGKISKTKIRKAIERKEYSGWDDPRTWTLLSLKKRGIQPEAIRNFILRMGLSEADITIPVEILYSENRKIIDSKANRYFAVLNPIKIKIKDLVIDEIKISLHPDFPNRGYRKIPIDKNKIYIESEDFEKFEDKNIGLAYLATINLSKTPKFISKNIPLELQKIHWVSEPHEKIKILMPNGEIKTAIAEPDIKKVKVNQLIQLFRIGFCRVDKVGREIILYYAHK